MRRARTRFPHVLLIAFSLSCVPAANTQTFTVLHTFTNGADGGNPDSMLTIDGNGNLYGTTLDGGSGFGTVFAMTQSNGRWNLRPIYDFKGNNGDDDGAGPYARVIFGPDGELYGATVAGGGGTVQTGCADLQYNGCGTVFSLKQSRNGGGEFEEHRLVGDRRNARGASDLGLVDPDLGLTSRRCFGGARCPWIETSLMKFVTGPGGVYPLGGVVFDPSGNIYGTTNLGSGLGTAYELSPSSGDWTGTTLVSFTGSNGGEPYDTLVLDHAGNLYGTARGGGASGDGIVFELSPSQSGWTETILHSFDNTDGSQPFGGVVFDSHGNLFGVTSCGGSGNGGTVYELSPSGQSWQFSVLYNFTGDCQWGPADSLTVDSSGNLYGTAYRDGANQNGSVFKLTHSSSGWTFADLHDFDNDAGGCEPNGGVVLDSSGNIYGTTTACGNDEAGTVWEITP